MIAVSDDPGASGRPARAGSPLWSTSHCRWMVNFGARLMSAFDPSRHWKSGLSRLSVLVLPADKPSGFLSSAHETSCGCKLSRTGRPREPERPVPGGSGLNLYGPLGLGRRSLWVLSGYPNGQARIDQAYTHEHTPIPATAAIISPWRNASCNVGKGLRFAVSACVWVH
jgi:hypothetical protein